MSQMSTAFQERGKEAEAKNASRDAGLLGAGRGTKRRNYVLLTVGLVAILLSGLLSYIVLSASQAKTPVYLAAQDLEPGDTVDGDSVRSVEIDVDGVGFDVVPVASLAVDDREDGRTVVASRFIAEGSLIPASNLRYEGPNEFATERIGVVLEAGPFPELGLAEGKQVRVIRIGGADSGAEFVSTAEIVGLEPLGEVGPWFVTLQIPRSHAVEVADLASRDLIRLSVPEPE